MPSVPTAADYPLLPPLPTAIASLYGLPAFDGGWEDQLLLLPTGDVSDAGQWAALPDLSTAAARHLIPATSFRLTPTQPPVGEDEHLFGGGYDPTNLFVGEMKTRATAEMPLLVAQNGWIDASFARLWHYARVGVRGTATAVVGRVREIGQTLPIAPGATTIAVSNIVDFLAIPTPFLAEVFADPTLPLRRVRLGSVLVSAATRETRTLHLSAPTTVSIPAGATVVYRAEANNPAHGSESAFTLLSLREGMLRPAVVAKLTINARADAGVTVETEFAAGALDRRTQPAHLAEQARILSEASRTQAVRRIVEGNTVRIGTQSARSGTFGLMGAIGDPLFGGYQGLSLPTLTVTALTLSVDNATEEVYGAWSHASDRAVRSRENRYPVALGSPKGRTVKGTITYREPISAWSVAERLSGPSSLAGNRGIALDFGTFMIPIPEVAWSPATVQIDADKPIERTLEWTMVGETADSLPTLAISTQA